jgi:hypothetical protein
MRINDRHTLAFVVAYCLLMVVVLFGAVHVGKISAGRVDASGNPLTEVSR